MARIKKELKFISTVLLGILPMLLYLDFVMGIQLDRDYGVWTVCGFIACVLFYAEFTERMRNQKTLTTNREHHPGENMDDLITIAELSAKAMEQRDWHKLTRPEKYLVRALEEGGFLVRNDPPNGFVGAATKTP